MEIEVYTHRIKVSQPRIFVMIDGPFIEGASEEEKEKDRKSIEACDVFNATMTEIYGPPSKDGWAGGYWWPEWMTKKDKLALALAVEDFKQFLRKESAQAYALWVDREKDKKENDSNKTT